MIKILVDSDIIIDFLRTGEGSLPKFLEDQRDGKCELYLSSVTVLELFAGKSSKRIAGKLRELIDGFVVIPVNVEFALFAGELKRDHTLQVMLADLLVGATSVFIGARLATRNKRHFRGISKLRFAV